LTYAPAQVPDRTPPKSRNPIYSSQFSLCDNLCSIGMLIPGNIPNIVAAGRLGIGSREWARVGLITGLPLMALCFVVLLWMR
jgi:predicted cation transporter